jgi:hypothetical protein
VHSSFHDEDNYGRAETDFFENGRNHQRPKAHWVGRDEDKGDLSRQGDARESIEEAWMRDGRRIIAPDERKHKVKRCEDQQSPNSRNPKYNLRKSRRFLEELR